MTVPFVDLHRQYLRHKAELDEAMAEVIASKDRSRAGTSAPACGLYLSRVDYPFLA